jgi:hypothetical protein
MREANLPKREPVSKLTASYHSMPNAFLGRTSCREEPSVMILPITSGYMSDTYNDLPKMCEY